MPLRSFSQREILLKARRRLEAPLLMTVWLSVAMFSLAEGNYLYLIAGTIVVAVNLLAALRGKELYLERMLVNILVLGATGLFVLELLAPESLSTFAVGSVTVLAIAHYIILIQLCKLFERKRNRDYVQMVTLSALTVLAGSLICDFLWYALAVVLYVALACYTGMMLTLKRGLDAAAEALLPTEDQPPPPAQAAWNALRDWPGRALRRRLASVFATALATAAVLFMAAPRLGQALPAAMQALAVTGLAPTIRLGQTSQVYQSDRLVMRVRLRGPTGQRLNPMSLSHLAGSTVGRMEMSCATAC